MTSLTAASLEQIVDDAETLQLEANKIATDISSNGTQMSELVEQLGFALASTSVEMRVSGLRMLSSVLKELPPNCLNSNQVEFLTTFYADRAKDHYKTIPALIDGMQALIHMHNMLLVNINKLLYSFSQHVTLHMQVREDRYKIFEIYKYVVKKYTEELKDVDVNFITGLISATDGERDPRNLDLIFSFMPALISQCNLYHLAEEMFENFACYFPVDFTPSIEDPATITREILADKLANCLVASPAFLPWIVSLALDKIQSDLIMAKLDSLDILQRAALKNTPQSMSMHFEEIWNTIKPIIFPGSEHAEVLNAGLQLLQILLEQAAKDAELSNAQQTIVLAVILPYLNDVTQRLFNPAASIALVCVSANVAYAAPKILNTYLITLRSLDENAYEEYMQIYTNLAQIFKIATLREALTNLNANEICTELQKIVLRTLQVDFKLQETTTLSNVDMKRIGFTVLAECAPIIGEAERATVYKILQLILHKNAEILEEEIQVIERFGALYPVELHAHYLDACLKEFDTCATQIKRNILASLLPLVRQMAFTQRILDLMFHCIFKEEVLPETRLLTLQAFNELLLKEHKQFVVDLQHNSNLIEKLVELRLQLPATPHETWQWKFLEQLGMAIAFLMQHLELAEQYIIVTNYLPNLNLLQKQSDIFVLQGLLNKLHADISLDDHFECLLNELLQIALNKALPLQVRQVSQHLICSLVNKVNADSVCWTITLQMLQKLIDELKSSEQAVETMGWFAKALVVRGASEAEKIIVALLEVMDEPQLVNAAIDAIEIITKECNEVYLPNVKFLHNQKFFHLFTKHLELKVGGDIAANSNPHHLKALMHLLQIALQIVRININKIGPVLLKVLEGSYDTQTIKTALETCSSMVQEKEPYFSINLQVIINCCLKIYKTSKHMNVRIAALNLLRDLTKYPTSILLPHKVDTVLELLPALDDHKRWVRFAAVHARNAWSLVGSNIEITG